MSYIPMIILGVLVGLSSVFLGLGGGVFIVPALTLFFSTEVHAAVGTSLATVFLVTTVNTILFHRDKLIDWRFALTVGPISAVLSWLTAQIALMVPGFYIKLILALLYLFLCLLLILRFVRKGQKERPWLQARKNLVSYFIGSIAGFFSGLTGIGSGIIVGPLVLSLKFVEAHKYSPTLNAVMAFTTSAGAISYMTGPWNGLSLGFVKADYALMLFFFAFLTSVLTRKYQKLLPEKARVLALVGVLVFLSSKLFLSLK